MGLDPALMLGFIAVRFSMKRILRGTHPVFQVAEYEIGLVVGFDVLWPQYLSCLYRR